MMWRAALDRGLLPDDEVIRQISGQEAFAKGRSVEELRWPEEPLVRGGVLGAWGGGYGRPCGLGQGQGMMCAVSGGKGQALDSMAVAGIGQDDLVSVTGAGQPCGQPCGHC